MDLLAEESLVPGTAIVPTQVLRGHVRDMLAEPGHRGVITWDDPSQLPLEGHQEGTQHAFEELDRVLHTSTAL